SAAITDGTIVLGGRDKMVHGLDAATGKPRWTFTTRARVDSSPVVVGDRVYVGSSDGRFYVLDLRKGEKLWDFEAGGPVTPSPAVAGGRVATRAPDGPVLLFPQRRAARFSHGRQPIRGVRGRRRCARLARGDASTSAGAGRRMARRRVRAELRVREVDGSPDSHAPGAVRDGLRQPSAVRPDGAGVRRAAVR